MWCVKELIETLEEGKQQKETAIWKRGRAQQSSSQGKKKQNAILCTFLQETKELLPDSLF